MRGHEGVHGREGAEAGPPPRVDLDDEKRNGDFVRGLIEAHRTDRDTFAWQGGEPTLMGVDFFRRAVALAEQHFHRRAGIQPTPPRFRVVQCQQKLRCRDPERRHRFFPGPHEQGLSRRSGGLL